MAKRWIFMGSPWAAFAAGLRRRSSGGAPPSGLPLPVLDWNFAGLFRHRSGGTVNCVAALIPSAAIAGRIPFST
jgi:hypothetical protein